MTAFVAAVVVWLPYSPLAGLLDFQALPVAFLAAIGGIVAMYVAGHGAIDAGDAGLTVLNLTDPTLSGSVIKVLRDVATHHPAWFQAARAGQSFQLEKGVRIGPDGLWVSGRTAADWSGIVTEITRRDVIEIRGPLPHSARRDALLGLAVGGALFGGVAAGMCAASGGTGPCAGEVAAAAAIGGGLMAGLGAGAGAAGNAFHPKQGVLYHGP
jgi:hypothetical protein